MQFGLLGERLPHSFSKEIHGLIGGYEYSLCEVARENFQTFMEAKNFRGLNVTIPYKKDVIPFLDSLSEQAQKIGAVNTIINEGGKLRGYNTDFFGLKALIQKTGLEIRGKKVLILGTGGTSQTAEAVVQELKAAKILKVSRSPKGDAIDYNAATTAHSDANIIINTTPLGMYPDNNALPISLASFKNLEGVVDVIYNPLRTKLVLEAQTRGLLSAGGLFMLVAQAVYAAEKFLDQKISQEKAAEIFSKILSQKENLVLTGMPGSGKSTVGKLAAMALQKTFVDTDDLITEKYGATPSVVIQEKGIETFRAYEKEVVAEAGAKTGLVIATGGGAVLAPENITALKQNGRIIFLDRPIEEIVPTPDRPLSLDRAALQKRYDERIDTYRQTADCVLKVKGDAVATAAEAQKLFKEFTS